MLTRCDVAAVESGSGGALSVLCTAADRFTAEQSLPSSHVTLSYEAAAGRKRVGLDSSLVGSGGSSSSGGESTWNHMLSSAGARVLQWRGNGLLHSHPSSKTPLARSLRTAPLTEMRTHSANSNWDFSPAH